MKSRLSQILGIDSFPMSIWSFPHKVKGFPKFPHEGLGFPPQGLSVVKTVHTQIYSRLVVQGTSCSKSSTLWKVSLSAAGLSRTQQVNQLGIENPLTLYKRQLVSSEIILFLIADCWSRQRVIPFILFILIRPNPTSQLPRRPAPQIRNGSARGPHHRDGEDVYSREQRWVFSKISVLNFHRLPTSTSSVSRGVLHFAQFLL